MNTRISMIAAIGKNRELGKNNQLIWRISDDLRRVKTLTTGNVIIMGRNTFNSIGHPLPNRTNIVLSQSVTAIDGCIVCTSLQDALKKAEQLGVREIFIFGGASVYTEALPYAERLYLTLIAAEDAEADSFFPAYDDFSKIIEEEPHPESTPSFTWITLDRP